MAFDKIFGIAHISEQSSDSGAATNLTRLCLTGLQDSIRANSSLHELLLELYGEDLEHRETEMATFTLASIRLQDKNETTLPDLPGKQ